MELAAVSKAPSSSTILGRRSHVPLRVRPGERPVFVDLPPAAVDPWLVGAREAQVGLDCWVAVCLELRLLEQALAPAGEHIVGALDDVSASTTSVLAPTEALRVWQRQLDRRVQPEQATSVALPERVVVRGRGELACASSSQAGRRALRWERHAAGHGETMEAWALRCALMFASAAG